MMLHLGFMVLFLMYYKRPFLFPKLLDFTKQADCRGYQIFIWYAIFLCFTVTSQIDILISKLPSSLYFHNKLLKILTKVTLQSNIYLLKGSKSERCVKTGIFN